jgi:predicted Zn-dependent peptidase
MLQNSTRQGIIVQLVFLDLHGLDISYITNYIKNIQAVAAEDVQNVMNKYLKSSDMTIVVVGDRKKIEKSIAPFGPIQSL